ncbi:MAG: LCP family protein [Bacilli bacterium]|nr:LCP family protein [Bacilli bacterium]
MKKRNIIYNIIFSISFLSFILLFFYVNKIGLIPEKYYSLFMGIELFILILIFLLFKIKNTIINIILVIFLFFLLFINSFGLYYVKNLDKFIDSMFTNEIINTTTFYVITSKKNDNNSISKVSLDTNINYYLDSNIHKEARKLLGEYEYSKIEDLYLYLNENNNADTYLLVDKINYIMAFENNRLLNKDDYYIIYEFDVKSSEKRNNEVKDSYNILVLGKDFSMSRNDLNMLITINTKTNKMLITSIPRDYYIPTSGYQYNDSLLYMSVLGDDVVIKSLEDFFGIKIDYKINIFTNNLVDIVDEIGGITYCSDSSYRTTHALVIGTYDDTKGKKLYVKKGCQNLNGIQTLTVARERLAFKSGDRQRQINCRKIMINILEKILSTSTLTNYTSILDSFSDFYSTNMNRNALTILIRSAIKNGGYDVVEQSVDGEGGIGPIAQNKGRSDLMYPNMKTVIKASNKINEILNEE